MKKYVIIAAMLFFVGCSQAEVAHMIEFSDHKVTVFSGGKEVRVYKSKGLPLNEYQSDGWMFKDAATGSLVRVSGTVIIESL